MCCAFPRRSTRPSCTASSSSETENLYAASSYFASIRSRNNGAFLERYHTAFGDNPPPANAFGESCYEGIYSLAALIEEAGSLDARELTPLRPNNRSNAPRAAMKRAQSVVVGIPSISPGWTATISRLSPGDKITCLFKYCIHNIFPASQTHGDLYDLLATPLPSTLGDRNHYADCRPRGLPLWALGAENPIVVGSLHDQSGPIAASGRTDGLRAATRDR